MTKLFFTPWVPPDFDGTLILAESVPRGDETDSVTGWSDHPDSEWPHGFVTRHVGIKRIHDDDTFRALRESFVVGGKILSPNQFWNRYAFTNLVTRLMQRTDRGFERPNRQDERSAREQLPLVLQFVRPQRIFIASAWGFEALKTLSDTGGYATFDKGIWEMTFGGIPVVGTYHPKARQWNIELGRRATARLGSLNAQRKMDVQ